MAVKSEILKSCKEKPALTDLLIEGDWSTSEGGIVGVISTVAVVADYTGGCGKDGPVRIDVSSKVAMSSPSNGIANTAGMVAEMIVAVACINTL
jgi:hypothetical protein